MIQYLFSLLNDGASTAMRLPTYNAQQASNANDAHSLYRLFISRTAVDWFSYSRLNKKT